MNDYEFVLPAGVESRIYDYALYIANDSVAHSVACVEDVTARMRSVVELPLAHPVAEDESRRLGFEVRKLTLGSYIAMYRVDEQARQVIVVDFQHGAQRRPAGD